MKRVCLSKAASPLFRDFRFTKHSAQGHLNKEQIREAGFTYQHLFPQKSKFSGDLSVADIKEIFELAAATPPFLSTDSSRFRLVFHAKFDEAIGQLDGIDLFWVRVVMDLQGNMITAFPCRLVNE